MHPPVSVMPFANVDDAGVDVRLICAKVGPPVKGEVPVPLTVRVPPNPEGEVLLTTRLVSVEVPAERLAAERLPVKVLVPVPCTTRRFVVVAPPEMVSPPACVPSPIVEEAVVMRFFKMVRPLLKICRMR